jgi:hypothetical protein
VDAAVEVLGDLRHRQAIQVAQRQRDPLRHRQPGQSRVGGRGVEELIPRVVQLLIRRLDDRQLALLTGQPPPVIDQLVARHADEPCHGRLGDGAVPTGCDRGHKRLRRQVLGDRDAAAARQQVAVDLRQRDRVDRHQRVDVPCFFARGHTPSSFGRAAFRTSRS